MKMYHPEAEEPIEVHPSQIKTMENRGWSTTKPKKKKVEQAAK